MRLRFTAVILLLLPLDATAQDTTQDDVPTLTNEAEVADVVRGRMPRNLRDVAAGFTTVMRVLVNDTGSVDSVHTAVSSGWSRLDFIARDAAQKARFAIPDAAQSGTSQWVELPIRFPRGASAEDGVTGAGAPVNRDDIVAYLQEAYPDDLRQLRMQAVTDAVLKVDADGRVEDIDVGRSRCFPTAADPVEKAARALRFTPDSTVSGPRRVLLTVTFSRGDARLRMTGDTLQPTPPTRDALPDEDGDGPTRRPQLRNRSVVTAALSSMYPKNLADAGIRGTAVVWIAVDTEGDPVEVRLQRSSGRCELDIAALRVANEMRFSPALNKGRPVELWVEIPINFGSDRRRL